MQRPKYFPNIRCGESHDIGGRLCRDEYSPTVPPQPQPEYNPEPVAVPEPGALPLLLVGVAALIAIKRRNRK